MNWKATGWFLLVVGLAMAGIAALVARSKAKAFDDCRLDNAMRVLQGADSYALLDCHDTAAVGWVVSAIGGGVALVAIALLVGASTSTTPRAPTGAPRYRDAPNPRSRVQPPGDSDVS
ncbi:MAG: hypothetical protein JWN99_2509 [Ilumatobacteraceae bacterium]|nr:hypothetical protein [Ilumatobacteraceae bacterium]